MKKDKFKYLKGVSIGFILLLMLLGIFGSILQAIQEVREGHGLDYYFTGYGVQMNYIGFLVVIAIIPIALLIGLLIRFWSKRGEDWLIDRSVKRWKGSKKEGNP